MGDLVRSTVVRHAEVMLLGPTRHSKPFLTMEAETVPAAQVIEQSGRAIIPNKMEQTSKIPYLAALGRTFHESSGNLMPASFPAPAHREEHGILRNH